MAEEKNATVPREGAAPPPLSGLLERILDEVEADAPSHPSTDTRPPVVEPSSAEDLLSGGNPLGLLLRNPALLSALPVLGGLGGTGAAPSVVRPHALDRHTALLCALKPYLSPHRRDTADTVIRLCRVWDALEKSGISLAGLLGSVGNNDHQEEGRGDGVQ